MNPAQRELFSTDPLRDLCDSMGFYDGYEIYAECLSLVGPEFAPVSADADQLHYLQQLAELGLVERKLEYDRRENGLICGSRVYFRVSEQRSTRC